jgi:hypothetical protein
MKRTLSLALLGSSILPACNEPADANLENFTRSTTAYLAKRGDFCLGKSVWPIDVSPGDFESHSRNALQMPALERLGLVTSGDAVADIATEDGTVSRNVKRYELTTEGKRYYLTRDGTDSKTGKPTRSGDFCVGKLHLDKVVRWDKVETAGDRSHTVVTYTYGIDAPGWTLNPEIKAVFPVLAGIVQGAGRVNLKEPFTLIKGEWIADDLVSESTASEPALPAIVRAP